MGFSKPKDTILNWTEHLGMPGMQTSGYVCMDRGTWWSMNCTCGDRCHQQLNTWWQWAWGPGGQPWLCSGVSHAWGECRRWSWCPDSSPLLCPADCRPSAGWTAPAAQGPAPWQSTGGQGKCDLHTQNCLGESDNTTQAECDLRTVTHRTALVSWTTQHNTSRPGPTPCKVWVDRKKKTCTQLKTEQSWRVRQNTSRLRPASSNIQHSLGELTSRPGPRTLAKCEWTEKKKTCTKEQRTVSLSGTPQAVLVPAPWQSMAVQGKWVLYKRPQHSLSELAGTSKPGPSTLAKCRCPRKACPADSATAQSQWVGWHKQTWSQHLGKVQMSKESMSCRQRHSTVSVSWLAQANLVPAPWQSANV